MKFVVYLAGRDDATLAWHRSQDSIASSVVVPKSLVEKISCHLTSAGVIEGEIPKSYKGTDVPLRMCPGALSDLFADLADDAEEESDMAWLAEAVQGLCECEALCGDIHLIVGKA